MRRRSFLCVLLLLAVLAAPRIWRLTYPEVWVEDDSYLMCAFLITRGLQPYKDFVLPHFPILESILAAFFRMFAASVGTAEVLTTIVQLGSSLALFAVGEKLCGKVAGGVASLLFAFHPLLLRYHVFEREVFEVLPILLAAWLTIDMEHDENRLHGRKEILVGALLATAVLLKLSAIIYFAGTVLYLLSVRHPRKALRITVAFAAIFCSVSLIEYLSYGVPFLVQVFLFQMIGHSSVVPVLAKIQDVRTWLYPVVDFGIPGFLIMLRPGSPSAWRLPALQITMFALTNLLLKGTLWPHNMVEALPWLCLSCGILAQSVFQRLRGMGPGEASFANKFAPLAVLMALAGLVYFWHPGRSTPQRSIERKSLHEMSDYVRAHSAESEPVFVATLIAFEANRMEPVPYLEIAGTIRELEQQVQREGLVRSFATSPVRFRSLVENADRSHGMTAPLIANLIRKKAVPVVMNYVSYSPMMLISFSDSFLKSNGYTMELSVQNYRLWSLSKR